MLSVQAECRAGAPEALSVAYYEHESRPSVNVIQVCKRSQLAMCQDAKMPGCRRNAALRRYHICVMICADAIAEVDELPAENS